MTNSKHTKKALLSSVIALILCCSMLIGTTFAWFTDSVTSGTNHIVAGNLDVELYNGLDTNAAKVDETTPLFEEVTLWEPGVVAYENLTVANVGTLALKYQLSVNFQNENWVIDGEDEYKLSQILKVAVVEGGVTETDRDALVKSITNWQSLASFVEEGALLTENSYAAYGIVIYWEPSENDNNWNLNNGKTTNDKQALHIDLGINLVAYQKDHESDSFGNDYDVIDLWDGSVDEVPDAVDNVITITTGAELAALSEMVNNGTSYAGKTIVLDADIDLNNLAWTPIGACDSKTYFQGTFDGNGHTISNLYIDNSADTYMYSTSGLFGWIDAASATIKNLTVDGATVKGSHWVGVIAGYMTGKIINCTVTNATVIGYNVNDEANGDKVGGLIGYMNSGAALLDGNTVSNSTVTGYRDVAGLAGAVVANGTVINNTVENVNVFYSSENGAEIVSPKTAVTVGDSNKAINVTVTQASTVSSIGDLASALKNGGKVILSGNIENEDSTTYYGSASKLIDMTNGGVLDGNDNTIAAENEWDDTYDTVIYTNGGTIKNVTIKGAMRGVFSFGLTEDLILDHVTFEDVIYTVNDDAANGHAIKVSNSVLNGWTSWTTGHSEVSFTNCEFGEGKGYAFINAHQSATFTNCDFAEGFKVNPAKTDAYLTFVNCTYNGDLITKENVTDLLDAASDANLCIISNN